MVGSSNPARWIEPALKSLRILPSQSSNLSPRRSRTYRLTNSPDLASKPYMRGIRIDSRMPDHQILEAGYLSRRLQHLDFAIFGLQSCESPGCGKNQFGSRNAQRSRAEIW